MTTAEVSLILASWGALVATSLAILKVIEYRYYMSYQLHISPIATADFKSIEIDITNLGGRSITLRSISVVYGIAGEQGTELARVESNLPKLLEKEELFSSVIPRTAIVESAKTKPNLQRRYSTLWVVVTAASGRRFIKSISINHSIIPRDSNPLARNYIAADVFIDLPQLEPEDRYASEFARRGEILRR